MSQVSSVMLNGALVHGMPPLTGKHHDWLDKDVPGTVIEIVNARFPEVAFTLEIDGLRFATNTSLDREQLWTIYSATPDLLVPVKEALHDRVLKIAIDGRGQVLLALKAMLEEVIGTDSVIIPAMRDTFLNILPASASKASVVDQLLLPYRRALKNGWAFGDDVPDLDLLKQAGISIAMANAVPSVKAMATYETTHHDEDGVAQFIADHLSG